MGNNDLVERYIYAVTKNLSKHTREDVSKELNSLISDMLEEYCMGFEPNEKDIKAVLTELGDPSKLAEKYNPDEAKYLIGPSYYSKYKLILRIVLPCVVFGMTMAGVVRFITEPTMVWYTAFAEWIGMIISGMLTSFAVITLMFAIFQQYQVNIDTKYNSLDELPAVPKKNESISRVESLLSIGISIVFMTVFLMSPQIFCAVFIQSGEWIPIFNLEFIRGTWYIIVGFGCLGILRETFKLIYLRYTPQVMGITVITNILSAVLSCFWLFNSQVINPIFISEMVNLFMGKDEVVVGLFINFQYVFLGVILFALTLDTIMTIIRTAQVGKRDNIMF